MAVIPSLAADDDLFDKIDRDQATRSVAQSQASFDVAQRLISIRRAWAHISPFTAVRLAQAGVGADDPRMKDIATAEAKKKSRRGFGWHSIGDVVSAGGRLGDTALGGLDEAVAHVAKPVVRDVALGAQSLYEEAQGAVRNVAATSPEVAGAAVGAALGSIVPFAGTAAGAAVGGAIGGGLGFLARDEVKGKARWEPQSSGAIALGRLLKGEKVELGSGWLPNVQAGESKTDPNSTVTIGEEQTKRAQRVSIAGHALTPGRLLAAGVVEPGTEPYKVLSGIVDASLALSRYDPASAIMEPVGNVNRNRKVFTDAGGLFAHRPAILPEKAAAWLSSEDGLKIVKKLADTQGDNAFYDIWKATGGKLGARLTHDVANASTETEVADLLRPHLGIDIREKPEFSTFHPLENVRIAQTMPGSHFDPTDANESVKTVELWLKNAKASPGLIADSTRRMAAAQTDVGRFGVVEEVMKATENLLIEKGVDPERARRMTRLEEMANRDTRAYFTKSVADDVQVPGMYIDGDLHGITSPHLPSEFINRTISLPDVRDVRRATSGLSKVFDNELYKNAVSAVDFAQGQVWKRMALLRGAYTVRVLGEEQLRMAASGLDSMANHPLSLIAFRLGKKGAADVEGAAFKYRNADEFAEGLDEFNQALNRGFAGWVEPVRHLPIWRKVTKAEPEFARAAASEITQLAGDPIAREVARRAGDLDAVKAEFWGAGAQNLEGASGGLERLRVKMADQASGLHDRAVADRYIDSVLDRIQYKTAGRSELVDMIANGKFDGVDYYAAGNRMKVSKALRDHIASNVDSWADDSVMKLQHSISERGAAKWLDQATTWMFSNLMGERTNNLSRSPAFKQFYWNRVEELVPFADAQTQARLAQAARTNGLGEVAARIDAAAAKHGAQGTVDFARVDDIAKGFGLDETKKLLYDMGERSQFFDAYRLIFPFGEAWKEMVTRWATIGVERPQAYRRGQQIITGSRNAGFFYTNDRGEEVFAYPGSGWISEKLIGVPVPLTGRVAGLSLMTDVLPGVGPVVQYPASAFIKDKPEFDWMRNIVFPFGEPDVSHGALESLLPAWVQKWRQAGLTPLAQDEGQFNAAVMDVARYLASTGKYDTSNADGINKLLDDARGKARFVYALRGASQFAAPTAPTPEWVVADKDGRALVAQKLVTEYQKMLEKDPQNATLQMLDRYGENLFLLLQGKTAEVIPGAPITKEGSDWERNHPGVARSYPYAFGFFAPQGGDLDSAAFDRQMKAGRRVRLTPDQAVRLANGRVASAVYANAKAKVGPRPSAEQAAWLRQVRGALTEQYPGFGERVGVPESVSTDTLVRELQKAVGDDRLKDSPNLRPVSLYLQAREKAQQTAVASGLSENAFMTSRGMEGVRGWLRQIGEALSAENPDFAAVWDRVFDRELADPSTEQEAA